MRVAVPAALVLLAAGAWCVRAAETLRATPRAAAGPAAVLGGFTALAAHAVWLRADRAVLAHDEDRAVALLRTLVDLEPQVVSASRHAAQEIGWNMLQGRDDPATRWSLAREAVRILTRCVEGNPASAEARVNRGRYLWLKLHDEPELARAFARDVDARGPLPVALEDFERALDLDPRESEAAAGLAAAGTLLGVEAARADAWDAAQPALEAALRGYDVLLAVAAPDAEVARTSSAPDAVAYRENYARVLARRETAAALRDVARAPAEARAAALAGFREDHPGVLD
jgi:hypothetical protein